MVTVPKTKSKTSEFPSPKAARTRATILDAAKVVFEKRGYLDTRIADIMDESALAYGTFYTYFSSKEEVFRGVADQVVDDLYQRTASTYRGNDPIKRLESANRQFLVVYKQNAAFMTVVEQAATFNAEFAELRRSLRFRAVDRVKRSIERCIDQGIADPELDPRIAAHALVGMIDYFAYLWFALGEPFDQDQVEAVLTRIWVNALGLPRK